MSSILTEDIIKRVVHSNEKCTYLNDDYVILYKTMEVSDDKLSDYLEKIRRAQTSDINIPKVVDYKLLDESVGNASKGIFIEERAKGNNLNIRGIILRDNQEYDFRTIIGIYLEKVENYLEELEKRAFAPQEFYNKFLEDFINLYQFGLKPDPNSLNYFFDPTIGYTIIDPYPNESKMFNDKELFKYIINDIYGVSRPSILIKKDQIEGFYYLTEDLKARLDSASALLNRKIYQAFKKFDYSDEYILTGFENNKMRFFTENESLRVEDLVNKLEEQYNNLKQSTK